jgi:hypothetical protein
MRGVEWLALGLCGVLLSGCGSPTEPRYQVAPAVVLSPYEGPILWGALGDRVAEGELAIIAPISVQAGEPFTVSLGTWGTRYCSTVARVEINTSALAARIAPYHRHSTGGCPKMHESLPVHVELVFEHPGLAEIVVEGLSELGGDLITRTHPIQVR